MKTTDQLIEEYTNLVTFHAKADTVGKSEIRKMNKAAKRINKITEAIDARPDKSKFYKLFEHPDPDINAWAAFSAIERMNSNHKMVCKALHIIKELAKSKSVNAAGAKLWLNNWNNSANK